MKPGRLDGVSSATGMSLSASTDRLQDAGGILPRFIDQGPAGQRPPTGTTRIGLTVTLLNPPIRAVSSAPFGRFRQVDVRISSPMLALIRLGHDSEGLSAGVVLPGPPGPSGPPADPGAGADALRIGHTMGGPTPSSMTSQSQIPQRGRLPISELLIFLTDPLGRVRYLAL